MSPISEPQAFELQVDGVGVRGTSIGSGPPLVLIHGWTLDQRIFSFQVPAFAETLADDEVRAVLASPAAFG